ncbi:MAG TPA: HD domain-containing protein [Longimicrobium sp.]|nr:HD domain-containing protein [Longimicrobium sp.]
MSLPAATGAEPAPAPDPLALALAVLPAEAHPADSDALDALAARVRFLVEADRLKAVLRRTKLMDGSRRENSAEHSWHLALMAVVLAAHAAPPGTDLVRVLGMLLVHDVVEIDAGDTFAYDAASVGGQAAREAEAAGRLFGLLPGGEGDALRALWEEFDAGATPEARFAVALDRFQPLLQNVYGGGGTWREHGVTRAQVLRRMAPIERGAPALWPLVVALVEGARAAGHIAPDAPAP